MAVGGAGVDGALGRFDPLVAEWFTAAFAAPTAAQSGAWDAIGRGDHTLVVAPTGSGKTLAAFLSSINDLVVRNGRPDGPPEAQRKCSVLYLSPLKALAVDVERNLRSPLIGIGATAARRGTSLPEITVAVRSGDTSAADRRVFARDGADILITTPESLFLLLTSRAREMLTGITTVIIDEIHAVAGTKRGAHMAVSLDRLDALLEEPAQRVGLSATVRPVEEIGRFLTGGRPVTVVQPPSTKVIDVDVVVPVPDMSQLGQPSGDLTGRAAGEVPRTSIWPHVEERVVDLVEQHRSTIVFANSRRLAERLTARLNEIHAERLAVAEQADDPDGEWADDARGRSDRGGPPAQLMAQAGVSVGAAPVLAKAHHGSVSREQRSVIEEELKTGKLPAVVATSSLELGIDMGAVDLVIQVEAPPSVASGLQRIGRAGHQVGAASHGVMFPKFRGDLVSAAVVSRRMQSGAIEEISVITNPLDIVAQQIVAICAMDPITVDELHELLRRSAPFAALGRGALESVLDMLSGRYPSEQFAELRPRITWDRVTGELAGRQGAQRLAVTSGGTIPDRGLYGVFLAGSEVAGGGGRRVGELDEEMVYESRVGDVFALGSSSWRIVDITHDQVLVVPAPGLPGKLPFWKGDTLGRPAELGRAHGEFVRDVGTAPREEALAELRGAGLDEFAAVNLVDYLTEQSSATGVLPDEKTIVIERFRDELGDWRVVIHSPYGAAVHAPWSLVIAARMRERYGVDVAAMHADDGIVLRLPDVEYGGDDGEGSSSGAPPDFAEFLTLDPETVEAEVTAEIGGAAIFASRFRECAARALLLPRRQIGKRQPLWQQRQRASQLLEVASAYPSFPIVAEAVRECLSDVFDVPALVHLLTELRSRTVRVVEVTTSSPSPFASSLLFGYVAQFLYEGDSPLAERRAAALTVDPTLLAELLGRGDGLSLRDLLDPQALADTEAELQRLAENRQARNADEIADLLRILGPLSTLEVDLRSTVDDVGAVLGELAAARRVVEVRVGGELRWADPTDAGVLRDALGTALPPGIAESFLDRVPDPLGRLLGRYARTHGPFLATEAATRFGLGVAVVTDALRRMVGTGRLAEGEFRPLGREPEFLDAEVLRLLRRRSLAALRAEVEPVEPQALARFLPAWNGIGVRRGSQALRGVDGLVRAIEQLAGAQVPASALESLVLPARVRGYTPALLDELTASGEVLWTGHGSLPGEDGWVSLHLAETVALTLPLPPEDLIASLDAAAAAAAEVPGGPDTGAAEAERGAPPKSADDSAWGWVHRSILDFLGGGGAHFFRPIVEAVVGRGVRDVRGSADGAADGGGPGPLLGSAAYPTRAGGGGTPLVSDAEIADALWDLVFAGLITSDTLAPLRARLSGGRTTHKTQRAAPRARQRGASGLSLLAAGRGGRAAAAPRRAVTPPSVAGRWSMLPPAETDVTIRTAAAAEVLLDRHGIVTRGAVVAEGVPGGFAGVYRVLAALEETGRIRRGYFVEGLGAAQFAGAGAVDRVRTYAGLPGREPGAEPDDWSTPPEGGSADFDPVAAAGFDVDIPLPGESPADPAGAESSVAATGAPAPADGFDDDEDDDLSWPPDPPVGGGMRPGGRNGFPGSSGRPPYGPSTRHGVFGSVNPPGGRGGPGGQQPTGPTALVLAASDPANPYGAALPWPSRTGNDTSNDPSGAAAERSTDRHRPARRAGAMVVLVDGALVLFAERGGRSLLSFTTDPDALTAAAQGLAGLVTGGTLPGLTMVKIDGVDAVAGSGPVVEALVEAGFAITPRGLRLRRGPR
ncbi:DEAD/DEAH box helicase [Nakamurella flava]|uniref:DEAD/DEAH box helicase n=1 Tax=Nakamurella flava TaxID=2576308 RepID=A0A4U6QEL4_9ACTN|nr:DEAD/DEAH box helicase [Nakamurella flava]TKV58511.1 DEAD/DEAH box helicase [Nakamurella flava]